MLMSTNLEIQVRVENCDNGPQPQVHPQGQCREHPDTGSCRKWQQCLNSSLGDLRIQRSQDTCGLSRLHPRSQRWEQ